MSRNDLSLGGVALFRSLSAADIRQLESQCIWRHVERHRWIIEYQEPGDDVFFLTSGTVQVRIQSVCGREVLLRQIEAGGYFGELSALVNRPRSAGILTITDVTVARMPSSVFKAALHSHRDVCDRVIWSLANQVFQLTARVTEFTTLDIRHRLCAELLRLSRPAPGIPMHALISPPPLHAELAARVGARREAVSRQLKTLERIGLVERRRGALLLTDAMRLRKMIDDADELL